MKQDLAALPNDKTAYKKSVQRGPILLGALRNAFGDKPFALYRRTYNAVAALFLKKPTLTTTSYKGDMRFWDYTSYRKALAYYLAKRETFEEYLADPQHEAKEYIDLDFSVYFQCYKNKRATFAALQSFRQFYPNVPVLLLSDNGDDFSALARHFKCEYYHDSQNIGYWPCTDMYRWFTRLARACELFKTEWVLILEDDVRTRDRISKYPHAHLAGQGGGRGTRVTKQLSPAAQAFVKKSYPDAEFSGISGCGGSIFHRASFMNCFANLKPGDINTWGALDSGALGATDIALTFLFLVNGYVVRRWLDLSHDSIGNWGPAAAFDHQFKRYYRGGLLSEDEERTLATLT
ncbi:MAG: hypothetical protein KGI71_02445 [Patescibacteria group bacterium]|nr:hypothetical protein [Patescibacteria group bacterium]